MLSIKKQNEYDLLGWTYYYDSNNNPNYNKVYIHVEDGVISSIFAVDSGYEPQGEIIEIPDYCTIFPGLIDLHTHYEYNTIPIWERPYEEPWDNRHEWRMHSEYNKNIKDLYKTLLERWTQLCMNKSDDEELAKRKFLFLSEIQALAGGTTVLQEPFDIGDGDKPIITPHTILRSTGVASDLGLKKKTYSIIDFYKPDVAKTDIKPNIDTQDWKINLTDEYEEFLLNMLSGDSSDVNAYLVHLAEGRAGVLKPKGLNVDAYSKKEADRIMNVFAKCNPDVANQVKLTLIHGCGIDVETYKELIKKTGVGVVWSPVSNLILYEDTPDFYLYYKNKVIEKVCIGSDWSPSGSKHVWDEAKFAYKYLCKRVENIYSKTEIATDIFKMCTIYPASIIGADKVGNIRQGGFADFFIVNTGDHMESKDNNVVEALFKTSDMDTHAIIINGRVVYGDKEAFERFSEDYEYLPSSEQPSMGGKAILSMQNVLGTSLDSMITDLIQIFKDYSEEKQIDIQKSKLLASNDANYAFEIKKLVEKFC